jgi:c(7)-type cytochrome triheme protein
MRFQITFTVALLAALSVCFEPGSAAAGGRLPTLRYRGGQQGRVVFDHQLHASEGFRCNDCHTNFAGTGKPLFTTRKQGLISFADHTTGAKCFACHNANGVPDERKGAFYDGKGASDDCGTCHRKI